MKISANLAKAKNEILYNTLLFYDKKNPKTIKYKQEGLKILSEKVDFLPKDFAFRPKFIKQSSCIKVFDKLYLFISKANLKKPVEERFDALFHEVGHWLHFQNMPALTERKQIWANADIEKIKCDVSEYAVSANDGKEFVAEVFKGLVKGKVYDDYIMSLYKRLNGPNVRRGK